MILDLVRTVAPSAPLLTVAEAKAHMVVEHASDDALIEALIAAVTDHLDGYAGVLGRALIQQTWALHLETLGRGPIVLPLPPLIDVTSIAYVSPSGSAEILDPATYVAVPGRRCEVRPAFGLNWPAVRRQARGATVTFRCGYGSAASDVPPAIRQAAKIMVADLYEHRESGVVGTVTSEIKASVTAERLLRPYRLLPV